MNKYSVWKLLNVSSNIKLQRCIYCRSTCRDCIHYEIESLDSKGRCRCNYYGLWYDPAHYCGNGISIKNEMVSQSDDVSKNRILTMEESL